jgi:hypothetical protein
MEDLERQSEQPSHALSGRIGIVVVFGRDERQVAVCPTHDEIRAEEHCRRVLAPEGVVGLFRPRSVNGLEAARQHLAFAIPDVGLLVHRPAALGRVDLHTVRPPVPPGRALVAGGGEADGDDGFELLGRILLKGQRID